MTEQIMIYDPQKKPLTVEQVVDEVKKSYGKTMYYQIMFILANKKEVDFYREKLRPIFQGDLLVDNKYCLKTIQFKEVVLFVINPNCVRGHSMHQVYVSQNYEGKSNFYEAIQNGFETSYACSGNQVVIIEDHSA